MGEKNNKKLISFTADSEIFLNEMKNIAIETRSSQSAIFEISYCIGFVLLYCPDKSPELKELLQKRFGTASSDYINKIKTLLIELEDNNETDKS